MNQTILLIEDEKDIRAVYSEVLRDAGFTVLESTDGEAGQEQALSVKWDLLLLDIMLPKIDGLQILKKVRETPALSKLPIILLTNLGRDAVIKEGFELGASGYLIKSDMTPDKVVEEVKSFLKK
jgi:DNA-binding response OmpR family regulator